MWPIVSYNQLGYFESIDDILPHKSDEILILDGGEGFSFYPFTKIVGLTYGRCELKFYCLDGFRIPFHGVRPVYSVPTEW